MCRICKWLGKKFEFPNVDRWAAKADFEAWRFAQANDTQVQRRDTEGDAVQAAARSFDREPANALPTLMALAERGSVWSMLLIGYAYNTGTGVAVDQDQSEHWYRLAFSRGSQRAQLSLGLMYLRRSDYATSEEVFRVGVSDHWAPATYYLAVTKFRQAKTRAERDAARVLLKQASAEGDLGALYDLETWMAQGRFGLCQIPSGFRRLLETTKRVADFVESNASAGRKSSA